MHDHHDHHHHDHHENDHHDGHDGHGHHHHHGPASSTAGGRVITVRASSGLSGDIMLSGLARLAGLEQRQLDELVDELALPALRGTLAIEPRSVNAIGGWGCRIEFPEEHAHRSMADIGGIIKASRLPEAAKNLSLKAFALLAEAEGAVHGKAPEEVTFHEVGALDSILDICLVCRIFTLLEPARFVCSPLPLADGVINCAHGQLFSPAPAVAFLLREVPVYAFAGRGETVTPTALALLKALGAEFGPWPAMTVQSTVITYGGKVFENAPNGALWALGRAS